MSNRPRTDALFERCKNKSNIECMAELEELCRTIEGELALSKEVNAGLMPVCDNLESQLADMTKQRDALSNALAEVRAWGYRSTKERLSVFINKALAATKGESHATLQR